MNYSDKTNEAEPQTQKDADEEEDKPNWDRESEHTDTDLEAKVTSEEEDLEMLSKFRESLRAAADSAAQEETPKDGAYQSKKILTSENANSIAAYLDETADKNFIECPKCGKENQQGRAQAL